MISEKQLMALLAYINAYIDERIDEKVIDPVCSYDNIYPKERSRRLKDRLMKIPREI